MSRIGQESPTTQEVTGASADGGPTPRRRSVVVIMTDQQRAGFTAGSGFALDTMPTLDRLAATGTTFDRAYTPSPLCVPARISLLTGRYPTAHRVRQNSTARHATFGDDLLDVLRAEGYALHFAGKPHWHRGPDDFDVWAGPYMHTKGPQRDDADAAFDAWLDGLDHTVAEAATPFPLEQQLPYRIVSDAIAGLPEDDAGQPVLLWASFPEPHNPYQVPEPYFSMFGPDEVPDRMVGPEVMDRLGERYRWLHDLVESKRPGVDERWRDYRSRYCGMLRMIDDQIARLLEGVRRRLDDPIVIFLSDHGDYVGEYGLQRKGAGMCEALMRVPLIMTGGPVVVQRRNEPVSLTDLMPTICGLVGAPVPVGVQGRDLTPLLRGEHAPASEFGSCFGELGYGGIRYEVDDRPELHFPYEGTTYDELNTVTQSGGERMVVTERHKLIMGDDGRGRLFCLDDDPAEIDDRFDDPDLAAVRDELLRLLVRWQIRLTDDLPTGVYRPRTAAHNWRWADDPVTM